MRRASQPPGINIYEENHNVLRGLSLKSLHFHHKRHHGGFAYSAPRWRSLFPGKLAVLMFGKRANFQEIVLSVRGTLENLQAVRRSA